MSKRLISLGGNCEVAYQIKLHTEKADADYFDWLILPFDALVDALNNEFVGFLSLPELRIHENGKSVFNPRSGVMYFHDFPLNEDRMVLAGFQDYFTAVSSKYDHLRRKFLSLKDSNDEIVFIRRNVSRTQIKEISRIIGDKFSRLDFQVVAANESASESSDLAGGSSLEMVVPASGPDGLGLANVWCDELKRIGLIESGFKKKYADIVKVNHHHVFE